MDSFDNLQITCLTFQKNLFMTQRVKFQTICFLPFFPTGATFLTMNFTVSSLQLPSNQA